MGFLKPTQGKVAWNQMWGISFDGGLASKSKVGVTKTQIGTEMAVQLTDGTVAVYQVFGMSEAALRGRLPGGMTEKGVRCTDDHP